MKTSRYPCRYTPERWWAAWKHRELEGRRRDLAEGIRQLRDAIGRLDAQSKRVWP